MEVLDQRLRTLEERHLAEVALLRSELDEARCFGRMQEARATALERYLRTLGASTPQAAASAAATGGQQTRILAATTEPVSPTTRPPVSPGLLASRSCVRVPVASVVGPPLTVRTPRLSSGPAVSLAPPRRLVVAPTITSIVTAGPPTQVPLVLNTAEGSSWTNDVTYGGATGSMRRAVSASAAPLHVPLQTVAPPSIASPRRAPAVVISQPGALLRAQTPPRVTTVLQASSAIGESTPKARVASPALSAGVAAATSRVWSLPATPLPPGSYVTGARSLAVPAAPATGMCLMPPSVPAGPLPGLSLLPSLNRFEPA